MFPLSPGIPRLALLATAACGISRSPKLAWQEATVNSRPERDESELRDTRKSEAVVLAASALRHEVRSGESVKAHAEERLSMFWRVFGGTILSIFALVAVTLYNNLTNTINELRSEVNRSTEARAELVKKEEFNQRTQSMWDRVQALQELKPTVAGLKEQVAGYSEKQGDVKSVREHLTSLEQRLKAAEEDHKALTRAELTIAGLEQKAALREAQFKAAEDERKELAKHLAELRERLAKVEGATETKPMAKTPASKNN
jgi:DNA repair exonuclease SbcCD ATPase subunit